MPAFQYCCPTSGLDVQGWIADAPTDEDAARFDAVTCVVCGRLHLVCAKTGKLMEDDDE